jgi:hypothetical protein
MYNTKQKTKMIVKAKIARVDSPKDGVSATTGKPWKQRSILLSFNDAEGDEYISAGVDEDVWQQLCLEEGQEASVRLRFFTKRQMSGFVSNHIRIVN